MPLTSDQQTALTLLGANIRRARVRRGLTQEQLAEVAELNLRTVQKIEAGQLNILVTTLIRIANALTISFNRLLTVE